MDAAVALAPNDDARWQRIADALRETSERNEHTAVILERLTVQLDNHDRRISDLERREEHATERALDANAEEAAATSSLTPRSLPALLNRIYTDWRTVVMIGLALAWMWQTFVGPHLGIVLH